MTPPRPAEIEEYGRKGVEFLLRMIGQAPEQGQARRLRAQQRDREPGDGARVLIVSPRDWAAQIQYESVIGHALGLRGAQVKFLRCGGGLEICDRSNTYESPPMPCATCTRYSSGAIDAHGFDSVTIRSGWDGSTPDAWPELDLTSTSELDDVEYENLPLGRLVSIPVRWFLCAADLEMDPLAGVTNRAFLRSARRIADGINRALDEYEPDHVLLLNGLFLFECIAWALCKQRGIDVVTYERAFRKETLVFSRELPAGYYDFSTEWARSDRPLTPDESAELDQYLDARQGSSAFDQHWRFEEHDIEKGPGRLATLFTNLTWDTAVINKNFAFPSIRDWVNAAIRAFEARPQHQLVIRVHPAERSLPGKITRDSLSDHIHRTFGSLPPNVTVIEPTDMSSSYPLMEASDLGLVYTSTTGLELALAGTPVIVSGNTHYRDKGFTLDATSPDDFEAKLDQVLENPDSARPDAEMARRYAHLFFFRGPVRAPGVIEPLKGLARLSVTNLDELAPGANPDLDRICDGILEGRSFTEQPPPTGQRSAT